MLILFLDMSAVRIRTYHSKLDVRRTLVSVKSVKKRIRSSLSHTLISLMAIASSWYPWFSKRFSKIDVTQQLFLCASPEPRHPISFVSVFRVNVLHGLLL